MTSIDLIRQKLYPGNDAEFKSFIDTIKFGNPDKLTKSIIIDYCFLQNAMDKQQGTTERDKLNFDLCNSVLSSTAYSLSDFGENVDKNCIINDNNILTQKNPWICRCEDHLENDHYNMTLKNSIPANTTSSTSPLCSNTYCAASNMYNHYLTTSNCPSIQTCTVNIENSTLNTNNLILYCSSIQENSCPFTNNEECTNFCKVIEADSQIQNSDTTIPSWCEPYLNPIIPFCDIPENTGLWQCNPNLPIECQTQSPDQACFNLANKQCEGPNPPIECYPNETDDFCDLGDNDQLWQCSPDLPAECNVSQPNQNCFDLAGISCSGPNKPISCTNPPDTDSFCSLGTNSQLWQCSPDLPAECNVNQPSQNCFDLADKSCLGPNPPNSCITPPPTNNFCDLIGNENLWQCKYILPAYCRVSNPPQDCFDMVDKSCSGPLPPKSCYDNIPEDTVNYLYIFIFIILIIVIFILIFAIIKRIKKIK